MSTKRKRTVKPERKTQGIKRCNCAETRIERDGYTDYLELGIYHNCEYVAARNMLVPEAARRAANIADSQLNPDASDEERSKWGAVFSQALSAIMDSQSVEIHKKFMSVR